MSGRISGEDIRLLMDNIGSEDLPDNWQALADAIGIVNVLKLCKSFGGTSLYVPKVDSVIAPAKKRIILKKFDGSNHKELAMRFDVSERSVYEIVAEEGWRKNQMKLF